MCRTYIFRVRKHSYNLRKKLRKPIFAASMLIKIFIFLSVIMNASAYADSCGNAPDILEEILDRKEIRVGWISAKPFQYRNENGELKGAFINAGNMLASQLLNVKITWVEARWDTFIAGLQSGKFDVVISNVARRPNRALSIWFTKPVAHGYQAFLVRKDAHVKSMTDIDRPENNIVVRMGSAAHITYTSNNETYFKHATIKPIVPPVSPEQEVASGRSIAMGAPLSELIQIAKANSDWAEILNLSNGLPTGSIGFVVPQCQHNLLHFMNLFVDTLIETRYMDKQAKLFPDIVPEQYIAPTKLLGDLPK